MAWVFGWGCFEMECFKTVLTHIAGLFVLIAAIGVLLAVVVAATVGTVFVLGIDPQGAWPLAVLVTYLIVCFGAVGGLVEHFG
jgi:hypothetical protein